MSGRLMRILVVDDDHDNADSLGELFEMEGHEVRVVHSGEDAVSAYRGESFDLAFMDVMMPGMNGVESFLEIRRMKPSARVYMMTGYSVEELLHQAVTGGALGVLEKPFDLQQVLRLTESMGPSGMLVASPDSRTQNIGVAIHEAISAMGRTCKLLCDANTARAPFGVDDVVIVDTRLPLIDGLSIYRDMRMSGHVAPTILVAPACDAAPDERASLRDIAVSGVLSKPFDPADLLARLPTLAA